MSKLKRAVIQQIKRGAWLAVAAAAVVASGCTWVDANPGSEVVSIRSISGVGNCNRIGEASVETAYKVGFVLRSAEKVQNELNSLGKNEAIKMGGNAIVPTGRSYEGRQSYVVYRCP